MDSRMFTVVTGPDGFPQHLETEDRIFMSLTLFISYKTEVSISLSLLSLLFFLLFFCFTSCFFYFCLFCHFSFPFWLGKFMLLKSKRPNDLKPSCHFRLKTGLMSCSRLCVGRNRRVHCSLFPGFERKVQLGTPCYGFFFECEVSTAPYRFSELNEFLDEAQITGGNVISREGGEEKKDREGGWKRLVRHGFH